MTSKFSIKSFLTLFCFLGIISILVFYISATAFKTSNPNDTIPFPILILLGFTAAWLFFGELRKKMIAVRLEENYIIIRKFCGLASAKKIFYSEIDGFKTSIHTSKGGDNEYLYIMQGANKIGKLSDFYHKNYSNLKKEIKSKLKDLGFEKCSYWDELKESFT